MAQQPLNSSVQPTDIYGGDEVAALVLDPGYCGTRAGFAGEDVPKSNIPSFYAHVGGRNLYGDEYITPREGLEVRNYMSRDSVVEDWDTAVKVWENVLVTRLQAGRPTTGLSRNGLGHDAADAAGKENGSGSAAKEGGAKDGEGSGGDKKAENGDVEMEDAAAAAESAAEAAIEQAAEREKGLTENPVLLTEAPWNTPKAREKAIEIFMETWDIPAFWLTRTPVLAAFAAGKATALVVDCGGANTSVTAVHDGMVLKRSVQRSPVGGLWLSSQIRAMWDSADPRVELTPTFLVENKSAVEAGQPAQWRPRKFGFEPTPSFRAYEEERVLTEFKESVVEIWRGPGRLANNEDFARGQPGRVFEFPDGANQMWRETRYKVSEGMWDETAAYSVPLAGSSSSGSSEQQQQDRLAKNQTIPGLIKAALDGVDVDVRPHLLANVVVTGATSLLNGFNDRLNNELQAMFPGTKVKIHAAGLTSERRFGAWIGGSILASLGTFHQMWISRKEYEENGPGIVEKRCK